MLKPATQSPPQTRRSFWLHFNKPEAKKRGRAMWTVHHMDACHVVEEVVCNVKLKSRCRKKQPMGVMTGKAESIKIEDNIAYIK